MSFDLQPILASKRALRAKLAALPIAEKLRWLDELRDREVTLRRASPRLASSAVRERSAPYRPAGSD